LFDGLHEGCQRPFVIVRFRTLSSGRQPVHDGSRFASPYECGSGSHANGRAASEEDFLKSQRTVVIVGQVRTRP
jgi:hypothetical protein